MDPGQILDEATLKAGKPVLATGHDGSASERLRRLMPAPSWRHISAAYNFQLHRFFHTLEYAIQQDDISPDLLPERLKLQLDEICLVHFSGEAKIWDHILNGTQATHIDLAKTMLQVQVAGALQDVGFINSHRLKCETMVC